MKLSVGRKNINVGQSNVSHTLHTHTHHASAVFSLVSSEPHPPSALIRLFSTGLMGSAAPSLQRFLPHTVCPLFAQDVFFMPANAASVSITFVFCFFFVCVFCAE